MYMYTYHRITAISNVPTYNMHRSVMYPREEEIWIKIITSVGISNSVLVSITDLLVGWDKQTESKILILVIILIEKTFETTFQTTSSLKVVKKVGAQILI